MESEFYPVIVGVDNAELQKYSAELYQGNWNERFQKITQQMRKFDANTKMEQVLAVSFSLINLSQDFVYAAK